jgi:hypothetical protein
MKSSSKGNTVLGCIDVDIRVGGSCHRQLVIGISSLWSIFPRNVRHFWVPMVAQETVCNRINTHDFSVGLQTDQSSYTAGDTVTGQIYVNVTKQAQPAQALLLHFH